MAMITGQDEMLQDLIKVFGIPDNCKSFEIRVAIDEIVTVKCEFYPEPDFKHIKADRPLLTKTYRLEEIKK